LGRYTLKEARSYSLLALQESIYDPENKSSLEPRDILKIEKGGKSILFNRTIQKHIIRILLERLRNSNSSNLLFHFYYILHLFSSLKLLQLSTIEIIALQNIPKGLVMQFNFFRLQKLIVNHLKLLNSNNSKLEESLDIEGIFVVERNYHVMVNDIIEYKNIYFQFLDEITRVDPLVKSIKEHHLHLERLHINIEKMYRLLQKNPRSIKKYTYYIKILRFEREGSEKLLKRLKSFKEIAQIKMNDDGPKDVNFIYDEKTTLFQVGATRDNLGKILLANTGASKLSGYSLEELFAMNIRQVLPDIISRKHNTYMMSAYNTGINNVLYKERVGFIRHKMGHIIHITLLVKPLFILGENSFKYISLIQPTQELDGFILTDARGRVDSFSLQLAKNIGLSPKRSSMSNLYIFNLFPNLLQFFVEKECEFNDEVDGIEDILSESHYLKAINKDLNGFFTGIMKSYSDYGGFLGIEPYLKMKGSKDERYEAC